MPPLDHYMLEVSLVIFPQRDLFMLHQRMNQLLLALSRLNFRQSLKVSMKKPDNTQVEWHLNLRVKILLTSKAHRLLSMFQEM